MRAWSLVGLALLLLPLSGCTQGDTGTGTSGFQATCPSWTFADHPVAGLTDTQLHNAQTAGQRERTTSETFPFGNGKARAKAPADEGGKKADQYQLRFPAAQSGSPYIFVENGTLTFKVFNNDTGQQLSLYDPADPSHTQVEWTFKSNGATPGVFRNVVLQVDLVPATQEPQPAPIRLEATFKAADGYIIGTGQSGTGHDRAGAIYSVEPFVHYRAPGCVLKP
jgi:hypothetical protein